MSPPPLAGLLIALFTVIVWGAQLPIAKAAMAEIDGYTVSLVRYGVAGLGFLLVLLWREGAASLSLGGRGMLVAASGVLGMAGSALLVFVGLTLTSPETAVIIIALQPAMAVLAEWFGKGRRPAGFTLGCLVLAFLGVVLVVSRGQPGLGAMAAAGPGALLGDLLVLLGAAAWVGYTLSTERFTGWSSLRIAALTSIAAMLAVVLVWLVALWLGAARLPEAGTLARHGWRLGYLSVLGVFVAMFLWTVGSRRIGPLNATLLLNLMPVVTFAFRALEGARFLPVEIAGATMVVGALVANNLYLRRPQAAAG